MANDEHVALLKEDVDAWNAWRVEKRYIRPDLKDADLRGAPLGGVDLSGANLSGAKLRRVYLSRANLSGAILVAADISGANLGGADLGGADLRWATLVGTDLIGADLTGCLIYGVSVWRLKPDTTTTQKNLVITWVDGPAITVDNIDVAQFIYLLLHNEKIRDVIDTVTSKAVLILGRFTPERKAVLDALREELRKRNYLPILFDFELPARQNITEI